jgi:probable rRNA maturation factor
VSPATVSVHAIDERDGSGDVGDIPLDPERWRRLADIVLVDEGVVGELDLTFVDETAMAALNQQHMGQDGPTDVLSFPLDGEDISAVTDDGVPRLLGDVVICPSVAARNAPGHGGTVDDELALLVVHGVLHVLGWDHAEDDEREAMQARERHHLQRWQS